MSFCGTKTQTVPGTSQTADPIAAGTGGREQRQQIFGRLDAARPMLDSLSARNTAQIITGSDNPIFEYAVNNARKSARGDYLNGSPQLDALINRSRIGAWRGFGDQAARLRSRFARTGMPFSTAYQQAEQNARAATAAGLADSEARIRYGDYVREQGRQDNALGQFMQALGSRSNLYQGAQQALLDPLQSQAKLVSGLTGGTAIPDTIIPGQSGLSALGQGVQTAGSAALLAKVLAGGAAF